MGIFVIGSLFSNVRHIYFANTEICDTVSSSPLLRVWLHDFHCKIHISFSRFAQCSQFDVFDVVMNGTFSFLKKTPINTL